VSAPSVVPTRVGVSRTTCFLGSDSERSSPRAWG